MLLRPIVPRLIYSIKKLPDLLEKFYECEKEFCDLFKPGKNEQFSEVLLDSYRNVLRKTEAVVFEIHDCFGFKMYDLTELAECSFEDKKKILAACYQASETVNEGFEKFKALEDFFFAQTKIPLQGKIILKQPNSELAFSETFYKNFLIKDLETLKQICGAINLAREHKETPLVRHISFYNSSRNSATDSAEDKPREVDFSATANKAKVL